MSDELKEAVERLQFLLTNLDAEERLEVFYLVREGYCQYCGYPAEMLACHCMNDE